MLSNRVKLKFENQKHKKIANFYLRKGQRHLIFLLKRLGQYNHLGDKNNIDLNEDLENLDQGACRGISVNSLVFNPDQWCDLMHKVHSIQSMDDFLLLSFLQRLHWIKQIQNIQQNKKITDIEKRFVIHRLRQQQNQNLTKILSFLNSVYFWQKYQSSLPHCSDKKYALAVIDGKLHFVGSYVYLFYIKEIEKLLFICQDILQQNNCQAPFRMVLNSGYHAIRVSFEPKKNSWFFMNPDFLLGKYSNSIDTLAKEIFLGFKVPFLKKLGLTIEFCFYGKNPPLHLFDLIEKKIKENFSFANPRIFEQDFFGFDCLYLATMFNQANLVKELLENNLSVTHVNPVNNTAFFHAVAFNHLESVQAFLNHGIDLQEFYAQAAFYQAVAKEYPQIIFWLLIFGANPNKKILDGNTALHLAAEKNNPFIFDLLLRAGGNPYITNDDQETVFDVLKKYKHMDLLRLLQRYINEKCHNYNSTNKSLNFFQCPIPQNGLRDDASLLRRKLHSSQ